jgi:hypothetical protein
LLFFHPYFWRVCSGFGIKQSSYTSGIEQSELWRRRSARSAPRDAQVQHFAIGALWNLAVNDANKVTLIEAGAHVRIIRAGPAPRPQDDAQQQVQNEACGALMNLAVWESAVQRARRML